MHRLMLHSGASQMMRYLASAALPSGQAINEELIANIAPLLDQVGSVFGEVRGTTTHSHRHAEEQCFCRSGRPSQ